jgi:hypothetical protein
MHAHLHYVAQEKTSNLCCAEKSAGEKTLIAFRAEKEKLKKLYEQLSANEHRSALPFGQAHSFATHEAASSEEQKNVGRELSAAEQVGQAHSFATHEATSSGEQKNAGGELSAAEQIGKADFFATHEATSSEEQKIVGGELSADEQIGKADFFATLP